MRSLVLVLLLIAGCTFDNSGVPSPGAPGSETATDASADESPPLVHDGGVIDASPPVSTPPDARVGVECGAATCGAGLVCCASATGSGTGLECNDKCHIGQAAFACDGPEDCPGKACCISSIGSKCASSCGPAQTACRSPADCPGTQQCCPTQVPSIDVCQSSCS